MSDEYPLQSTAIDCIHIRGPMLDFGPFLGRLDLSTSQDDWACFVINRYIFHCFLLFAAVSMFSLQRAIDVVM